jgi:hypothetical protein
VWVVERGRRGGPLNALQLMEWTEPLAIHRVPQHRGLRAVTQQWSKVSDGTCRGRIVPSQANTFQHQPASGSISILSSIVHVGKISSTSGGRSVGRVRSRTKGHGVSTRRYMWIDNIKMDLLEIGVSVVDWIGLAQDRYR